MLGRNCRFLQVPDTDPAALARVRAAITAGEEVREVRHFAATRAQCGKKGAPGEALFQRPALELMASITASGASMTPASIAEEIRAATDLKALYLGGQA